MNIEEVFKYLKSQRPDCGHENPFTWNGQTLYHNCCTHDYEDLIHMFNGYMVCTEMNIEEALKYLKTQT